MRRKRRLFALLLLGGLLAGLGFIFYAGHALAARPRRAGGGGGLPHDRGGDADRLRIRLGPLGPPLAPLLLAQLAPRLGISPSALRPIDRISRVRCSVFVISGAEDRHTTPAQTRALFARAEYERRVLGFISDSFPRKGQSSPALGPR